MPETQVTSSHSGELGSGRRYEGDSVVQDSYALEAGQDKSSIPENPCSQFDEIGQRPEGRVTSTIAFDTCILTDIATQNLKNVAAIPIHTTN